MFGKKPIIYFDFAPWISSQIKDLEKYCDLDLHVISPHRGLRHITQSFQINKTQFHFFLPMNYLFLVRLVRKLFRRCVSNYYLNRLIIRQIIKKLKPDLVNLIGTENPYYSTSGLDVNNLPLFITLQTVYSNPERMKYINNIDHEKWFFELELFKRAKYFGCGSLLYKEFVLANNPDATIFKYFFPPKKLSSNNENVKKKYDFIFFAAEVSRKKGVEDAIMALGYVKQKFNNVSLNITGKCDINYMKQLNQQIQKLGLEENITFQNYFPIHEDLHKHIRHARFAILPFKLDIISSALIEVIQLNLPVVTYKTSETPFLNKKGESILIAESGDIEQLGGLMISLMQDQNKGKELQNNAKKIITKEFDNSVLATNLLRTYNSIINHSRHNIKFPEDILL
jgi:glycosyltransferase involved in cell wall biosynthesis